MDLKIEDDTRTYRDRPSVIADRPETIKPLIEFTGAGKSFELAKGRFEAIRDVTLDVAEGDFITLLGPSGCGKSTLLSMTAGLFPPSTGTVRYRGHKVSGINPHVGYMTQQDHLLPWRDVVGNIAVPLEIRGVGKSERRDRVQQLIDMVGLKGFEKSYPTQLSGGMRKRCALARILAYDPETLLMDEPFGALDAQLRLALQMEIVRISRFLGKTVLFVTHDLDEAVALANRCVVFTKRPGTVRRVIEIDLPRDRDLLRLRFDPHYNAITRDLWQLMAPEVEFGEEAHQ